jgi:hypothetical protein
MNKIVHINRSAKIKAYESQIMTLKAANELDVLRGRLRKYSEKYTEDSLKIQAELQTANAQQDFYDKESEAVKETVVRTFSSR